MQQSITVVLALIAALATVRPDNLQAQTLSSRSSCAGGGLYNPTAGRCCAPGETVRNGICQSASTASSGSSSTGTFTFGDMCGQSCGRTVTLCEVTIHCPPCPPAE